MLRSDSFDVWRLEESTVRSGRFVRQDRGRRQASAGNAKYQKSKCCGGVSKKCALSRDLISRCDPVSAIWRSPEFDLRPGR